MDTVIVVLSIVGGLGCSLALVVAFVVVYLVGYNRGGQFVTEETNRALANFDAKRMDSNAKTIMDYSQRDGSVASHPVPVHITGPDAFRHPGPFDDQTGPATQP